MNILDINTKLEKHHTLYFPRVPYTYYYPELKNADVLFVGINPAGSVKDFKDKSKSDIQKHEYDVKFGKIYPYFRKFEQIANDLNSTWEHVDLFPYREKSQSKLKNILETKQAYIDKSFNIFFELVELVNPRVVVVCNAYARDLFEQHYIKETNKELFLKNGFFLINKTKFIFTSMLTGQRALDKGSLLLLEYHLKKILN